jgi:hypothetical protein
MKEIDCIMEALRANGANAIQVSAVNRMTLDEKTDSLDKQSVPPGEYIIAEVRVLIPVDR